jgi:hypothetical protein
VTVAGIACSSLRPLPAHNPVTRGLLYYVNALRIMQRWELFVPEPRRMATEYRVDIKFAKGTGVWKRTQPVKWDFFQRHEAYNFQKWDLAGHHLDTPSQLYRDLARYIMKRYDRDPANPMLSLQLVRAQADWPPPRESGWVGGEVADLQWKDRVLFTYYVKDGKMFY